MQKSAGIEWVGAGTGVQRAAGRFAGLVLGRGYGQGLANRV